MYRPPADVRGRIPPLSAPPRRVVSLVPSITETLFDLAVGGSVIGTTDFCIFPPALTLPQLGGTKNPRVEEIRALAPDLVHMNLEENLRRHGDAIERFAPLFVTEPKTVADVKALILTLGNLHACSAQAEEIADALDAELALLPRRPFSFACPIWKDPWMWCGGDTYVSSLVSSAGGVNVLASSKRYPQMAVKEVLRLEPEVIFLPDEPYLFTAADSAMFAPRRVVGPFAGHLFTWHGSRTVAGLRFLREELT